MNRLARNGLLSALFITALNATPAHAGLILTGVYDGPLAGGKPKGVALYADTDIADLSTWGLGKASNGDGSTDVEFHFPAVAIGRGTHLYVATETDGFHDFFGFAPDYTTLALSINGDDAIELFENGVMVDVFGDIATDGTGQAWEYKDGWAYRRNGTGPDGAVFDIANWTFSGPDAWDGETRNSTAAAPLPVNSYIAAPTGVEIPEPPVSWLLGLAVLFLPGLVHRRRLLGTTTA